MKVIRLKITTTKTKSLLNKLNNRVQRIEDRLSAFGDRSIEFANINNREKIDLKD